MFSVSVPFDKENVNTVNKVPTLGAKSGSILKPQMVEQAPVKQLNWTEVQTKNFTEWINFVFGEKDSEPLAVQEGNKIKDTLAFQLSAIFTEIDNNQLLVRDERDIHVDVGLHEVLLEILSSYNAAWLRVASEVVLGFQPTKHIKKQLLTHLLWIDKKHVSSSQLRKHFLKKTFELVMFLDVAKKGNLLGVALFDKSSEVKSSKEIIGMFCKEFLKGEGDIFRHLSSLNYRPNYEQTTLDEYEFQVKNFSVDLRDGVRLCRLVDTLNGYNMVTSAPDLNTSISLYKIVNSTSSLCSKLLIPALNITRKEHNMKVLFQHMQNNTAGALKGIKPSDVVSGNSEKTFLVLWEIFYQTKLRDLIDSKDIETEIANITGTQGVALNGLSKPAIRLFNDPMTNSEANLSTKIAALLITWIKAIVTKKLTTNHVLMQFQNHPILTSNTINQTASSLFNDGFVLCMVVNYYFPTALRENDICLPAEGLSNTVLQSNRVHNWNQLNQASKSVTGIPALTAEYVSNRPLFDNQPMIIFLSYLFSRLTASTSEVDRMPVVSENLNEVSVIGEATFFADNENDIIVDSSYLCGEESVLDISANISVAKGKKSLDGRRSSVGLRSSIGGAQRKSIMEEKQAKRRKSINTTVEVVAKARGNVSEFLKEQRQKRHSMTSSLREDVEWLMDTSEESIPKKTQVIVPVIDEIPIIEQSVVESFDIIVASSEIVNEASVTKDSIVNEAEDMETDMIVEVPVAVKDSNVMVAKVQALMRGVLTRNTRKRKLALIQTKLQKATAKAIANPSLKLGHRVVSAIKTLKNFQKSSLSGESVSVTSKEILTACMDLEFATEVSKVCCKNLVRDDSIKLLLHLIRSCDRSRDSQEVLCRAVTALLHVSRYDEFAHMIALGEHSAVATIIDMMQMFRDKKAVFAVTCELMCRVVSADKDAKALCMPPTDANKRISAISQIIESKFKIDSRIKALSDKNVVARPPNSLSPRKGKFIESSEPIDCIRLLMKLLC